MLIYIIFYQNDFKIIFHSDSEFKSVSKLSICWKWIGEWFVSNPFTSFSLTA